MDCKICFRTYDANEKKLTPRILTNCGHTMCEDCIGRQVEYEEIMCPFDRQVTFVGDDVEKLPKNFAVLEILEELNPQREAVVREPVVEEVARQEVRQYFVEDSDDDAGDVRHHSIVDSDEDAGDGQRRYHGSIVDSDLEDSEANGLTENGYTDNNDDDDWTAWYEGDEEEELDEVDPWENDYYYNSDGYPNEEEDEGDSEDDEQDQNWPDYNPEDYESEDRNSEEGYSDDVEEAVVEEEDDARQNSEGWPDDVNQYDNNQSDPEDSYNPHNHYYDSDNENYQDDQDWGGIVEQIALNLYNDNDDDGEDDEDYYNE
ncbi:hypothetical protein CRE_12021 [Caenorhabditis remanei]|uniref:RING-type domain-containing protein n=1 Tax=Caenorhabditis remanei TaxID=31234 RepID=E3MPS6_CAERE|nr:hypothetical protein CRE_12021 [Caenorhabditis remanei]